MPIITLQQRIRELGRIRIGQKVATANGGTRPAKLNRFRLTSPSRELLDKVAALYGGTVTPWSPDAKAAGQYEVVTEATRMPILVPNQPVSQYFELWSGGGCQRRCDGVTELLKDRPCICGPDPEMRQCKPTTRLNVVLADLAGVGVWRLESHGYYAALELPGVAELLAKAGGYVEAHLGLEERTAKRDGKTLRWMVPTIDVDITPSALIAGGGATPAVVGAARAAIESGRPDYAALAAVATTADEVGQLWRQAVHAGHMDDGLEAVLTARGAELRGKEPARADAPPPSVAEGKTPSETDDVQRELNPADYGDASPEHVAEFAAADGVHDAEIVDDGALEEIWFQIIAVAGTRGWTTDEVEQRFAQRHGGMTPATASAQQLSGFLAAVKAGDVA